MIGYWNVFPILGHMSDRLGVEVVNPAPVTLDTEPVVNLPPFKPNVNLFVIAGIKVSIGVVVAVTELRRRPEKSVP